MPTFLGSILIVLLAALLFLAALLIFRAMMFGRAPEPVEALEAPAVDAALVAEHLSAALQIQTDATGEDAQALEKMSRRLQELYPRVHGTLGRERVNGHSLLYTWAGRDPALEPVLLCAHMDVVPFDPATRSEWTHPPFSGAVADGFVWGRGALDMKSTLITIFEAVEGLIRAGYQPERTLLLGFGHDEELGGWQGANRIAALLAERGVALAAVLDEGGAVMAGAVPGLALPAALIGITEKGYATVEVKVEGRPGHSSMPPRHTAIGVLARALARLETRPMPARTSLARLMFEDLGPFLPFTMRMALANPFLFGNVVQKRLESNPQTNALIRTTMAITMIEGGLKDNVLPARAQAGVNCRLLPGDSRDRLVEHIRRAVNDEAVQITLPPENGWDAAPVSPVDSPVYRSLTRAIRQVFPDAIPAPYLMSGASDSRHYAALSPNVYRFSPYLLDSAQLRTIHGIDERISVEALGLMVTFYHQVIKSWTETETLR